jgi:hypothetical protein
MTRLFRLSIQITDILTTEFTYANDTLLPDDEFIKESFTAHLASLKVLDEHLRAELERENERQFKAPGSSPGFHNIKVRQTGPGEALLDLYLICNSCGTKVTPTGSPYHLRFDKKLCHCGGVLELD